MRIHKSKMARKEAMEAYLFILPFMAGIGVFNVYAFLKNIYISFTNKRGFGEATFVGLQNYRELLTSSRFYDALLNTFIYVLICVPAVVIISMLVAVALNTRVKGMGVYRTLIYLPAVTLSTAIALIWKWLLSTQFGLLNAGLEKLGIEGKAWLTDPGISMYAVCIVLIWSSIATAVVLFLAGLQGIPGNYYEAAEIDGANAVQKFLRITLPLLSPTTFMITMTEIIGFFQVFDLIYLMIPPTSSGVSGARSVVMLFFEEAFTKNYKGYGAAIANVLFVIILIITVIQTKLQNKWVYYD